MAEINYEDTAAAYHIPVALCKLGFIYYPKRDDMTSEEAYHMLKRRRAFWHGYKKALEDIERGGLLQTASDKGLKYEKED